MSAYGRGKAIKIYEADRWFSKAVRLAADNICVRCGAPSTELAHVHTRKHTTVRWDKDNGLAFCGNCHRDMEMSPLMFSDWFEHKYPGRKERLMIKLRGHIKNNPKTRALASKHYREEFRRMEATGDRDLKGW